MPVCSRVLTYYAASVGQRNKLNDAGRIKNQAVREIKQAALFLGWRLSAFSAKGRGTSNVGTKNRPAHAGFAALLLALRCQRSPVSMADVE